MRQNVTDLLAKYAALLNKHGVDSSEAQAFLEAHESNRRFAELAKLSRVLKVALTAPAVDAPCPDHLR